MDHGDTVSQSHWHPAQRPEELSPATAGGDLEQIPTTSPFTNLIRSSSQGDRDMTDASVDIGNDSENTDTADWRRSEQAPMVRNSKTETTPVGTTLSPSGQVGVSFLPKAPASGENGPAELSDDDDNERLDPAWGIRRLDSQQILQKVSRTNSFPSFAIDRQLPLSQAEQLMALPNGIEFGGATDGPAVQQSMDSAADNEAVNVESGTDYFDNFPEDHHEIDETSAEEARFDEGLPLISSESPDVAPSAEENDRRSLGVSLQTREGYEESSFFEKASLPVRQDLPVAPAFERKTTAHVLETLEYSAGDPPDSPVKMEPDQPFGALETAERPTAPDASQDDNEIFATNKVEDDSIWKAALDDDDEFLVEDPDDLLPDSEPASPSSFTEMLKGQTALNPHQNLPQAPAKNITAPKSDSRPDFSRHASSNPYAPHQPSTSDLTQLSPTTYGNMGFSKPVLAPMNSFQQHLQQRPTMPQSAQSFADKAKGGYQSPYDLPLELSKPRRRPQAVAPTQAPKAIAPPPRTSSMSSEKALQAPYSPTETTFPSSRQMTSPQARQPHSTMASPGATGVRSNQAARAAPTTFFEELPLTQKPRPPPVHGRFTPQQNSSMLPPQVLHISPPQQIPAPGRIPSPPQQHKDAYAQYQLRAPEKLDPYANVPLQPPAMPSVQPVSTRYSPAPAASQSGPRPMPSPRYSPAPPPAVASAPPLNRYASQPTAPSELPRGNVPLINRYASQNAVAQNTVALPFQPRTSSPLVHQDQTTNDYSATVAKAPEPMASKDTEFPFPVAPLQQTVHSTNRSGGTKPSADADAFYAQRQPPPRRSQTQSPSKQAARLNFPVLYEQSMQRPASVHAQVAEPRSFQNVEVLPPVRSHVRQRGLSQHLNFIEPSDGQEHDQLQRWKGAPIFRFGFGGSYVSSFPRHAPRYTASSSVPQIKANAGEVNVRSLKYLLPTSSLLESFPGPLRSKSKKKDVLLWMTNYINMLEQMNIGTGMSSQISALEKRHAEKVLLWKIVRAFVQFDGILDTGAEARKSISTVLSPEIFALDDASATQYRDDSRGAGIYQPAGKSGQTAPVDPVALDSIRRHLLKGEREKAVWLAVDNCQWAHAMLISSTLDRDVWKQVVQEFVRQEVKPAGANTESLAAVYEIFAGNLTESIDELVPPSARAGLQMLSKVDSNAPTKHALDGLDKWRETVALVLNNRSPNDAQALTALGSLLASYARIEASHICQMFARGPLQPNTFGGADDPQATVVLLGADHRVEPTTFHLNAEAIILTEIFEFASTVLVSGAASSSLPHLQVYKLQRAKHLAESGFKTEAQAYSDAIAGALKTSTKISSYFHPLFLAELDELSNRLKQVPIQSSTGWIAKPSLEKVSGSVWNKFSSFVAGDDSDAESKGSGRDINPDNGPFAKVTGTPSLSPSASHTDIQSSYPTQAAPPTAAGSRYAPNGMASARSSSEVTRGRPSLDSQRSPPSTSYSQSYNPTSLEQQAAQSPYMPLSSNTYQTSDQQPAATQYSSTPPQASHAPYQAQQISPKRLRKAESYMPTPPPDLPEAGYLTTLPPPAPEPDSLQHDYPVYGGYSALGQAEEPVEHGVTEPAQGPESSMASFEPPVPSYAYNPPGDTGYVPYQPDPEADSDSEKPKPKKKSFLDEDDDQFATMPRRTEAQSKPLGGDSTARKSANDAAAEAAFRAAAEADAQRAKEQEQEKGGKGKGSWFGGWLGGKKNESLDSAPKGGDPGKTVHRAHLGESKMTLHYDDKLKKWVNPGDPDSMKEKAAPPPPPKMGPGSRGLTPSGSMPSMPSVGMGSGPPSRSSTPADPPTSAGPLSSTFLPRPESSGFAGPPSTTATPPPGAGPPGLAAGIVPPSRPSTGMSGASDIDDLLGGPAASGRRTIKGKKGARAGRYVDVMAK